jgi:altronate dehydratase small subunit
MPDRYLKVIDTLDNVATAIRDVNAGETVEIEIGDEVRSIDISEDVPFGHKIALEDVNEGDTITKYGESIGNASESIKAGEWLHVHNVESNYGRGDLSSGSETEEVSG